MKSKIWDVICRDCGWKGTRKVRLPIRCPNCKKDECVWDHTTERNKKQMSKDEVVNGEIIEEFLGAN